MRSLFSDAPLECIRAEIEAGLDLMSEDEQRHCHYICSVTFERVLGAARVAKLAEDALTGTKPEPEPVPADLERAGNVVCLPGVTLANVRQSRRRKAR
jgi:hypothetical protein